MRWCRRSILLAAIALTVSSPVTADQWYEHYARAERALLEGDHETAIAELNQAIERRGDSGARIRTYGMRVTDYFPYLKLGIAYFAAGEYEAALRAFDTEEQLGAIRDSEAALAELGRFRNRAAEALERERSERQTAIDELVDRNLTEARDLERAGRLEEALAAVDRALAVAPENPDASALAESLREQVARRDDLRARRERAGVLIDEGERLRSDGRLTEAAARFRQAADLVPEGPAASLLAEVQADLAATSETTPTFDPADALTEASGLASAGELDTALALVQQVLAVAPDDARAAGLETEILDRMAEKDRATETGRLLAEAEDRHRSGDLEGAIASANLVLARDRGNTAALDLIRRAYASLSRRLLGEGPIQNLPPAIRLADLRDEEPDGALVHTVRDPSFRLTGVVIDETGVTVETVWPGASVTTDPASQSVGGVTITQFGIDAKLAVGRTTFEVIATDREGLASRSEYIVAYRRPLVRSPWLWAALVSVLVLAVVVAWVRAALRRQALRRRRFNPYVAGPPVLDPELVVGRDALIDRVLATVPNNSLLLLGERRIGKTTMLHQLRARLPGLDHPRFCFVPVSVDLQGVPEEAFFATVAEAVGEEIGDATMAAARSADGYDSRELMRDLRRALPAVECADDRTAKIVLLLDEIDELNGYSHRTNQRLRSLFMRSFADQLVAVAAGVGIARDWDHEGSPWYNFFEEIEVGPVDPVAARRLVIEPLRGAIAIDAEAVDRLLEIADGRPYQLQKLALAALQRVHEMRRTRITVDDVDAVV
jgi:tetratricopeptide (TPR) repeat protein